MPAAPRWVVAALGTRHHCSRLALEGLAAFAALDGLVPGGWRRAFAVPDAVRGA